MYGRSRGASASAGFAEAGLLCVGWEEGCVNFSRLEISSIGELQNFQRARKAGFTSAIRLSSPPGGSLPSVKSPLWWGKQSASVRSWQFLDYIVLHATCWRLLGLPEAESRRGDQKKSELDWLSTALQ